MNEDTSRERAKATWSETQLETLYRAVNQGYPDCRIREIVARLTALGIAVPYLIEKVQSECGAIGAGRLRRLAL